MLSRKSRGAWRRAFIAAAVAATMTGSAHAAPVHYWSFDEANSGTAQANNQVAGNPAATFQGSATRTTGLIGTGAALFNDGAGSSVNTGNTPYTFTTGFAVEALIKTQWSGAGYDEIFRKEDGGQRILFSFQSDTNNPGAQPAVAAGPVLSLGLMIGGVYNELDMPLDGATTPGLTSPRPTLAQITTGTHHVVAQYDSATGRKSIYVDGTERYFFGLAAGSLLTTGGGTVAAIGNSTPGGGEPFTGTIDEVAIYSSALTPAEIAGHFANVQQGQNYFVPEPSSLALVAGGALFAARRRRRRA